MRWHTRLAKYDFQVIYEKGSHNVYSDALSRLKTIAETTADDRDEIPSFLLNEQCLEHTEISNVTETKVPPELQYKHNRRKIHLLRQNDDYATHESAEQNDMAQDELFKIFPIAILADPIFEPISVEEMATAQLHHSFCTHISSHLNE